MKNKTKVLLIISVMIATLLFTACGQAQTTDTGTDTSAAPSASATPAGSASAGSQGSQAAANEQNAVYGEVTAINGNVITLTVGTLNQQTRPSGERQQGQGSKGQDQQNANPSGQPDANASARPSGSRPSMLTMTGETKTITVTDESVITKPSFNRPSGQNGNGQQASQQNSQQASQQPQFSNEKGSLSDIQVGATLRIVYASDNTTIQSIMVMGSFGRGSGQNGQQSAPEASASAS